MSVTIDIASAFWVIITILFAVLIIGIFWMMIAKVRSFFASRKFDGTDRETMRRRWMEIEQMLESPGEMSRKLAIIEADKLLDYALKSLAMPGMTLGERLKFAQYKYPDLREVWWAHKIRNQLAHETSYHLDAGLARNAIRTFKKALVRLGAI